jgi:hypothetical protein
MGITMGMYCTNLQTMDKIVLLLRATKYAKKSVPKCLEMIDNNQANLRMELASYVDFGKKITETIYDMEGDGFLIIHVYDRLKAIETHLGLLEKKDATTCNNIIATANLMSTKFGLVASELIAYALDKIAPAIQYFRGQLIKLDSQLKLFKAAKLFSPSYVGARPCNPEDVNELGAVAVFKNPAILTVLKEEYINYHTLAVQCPLNVDPLLWWPRVSTQLPFWSTACKKMILYQPSSGASERVFSMLRNGIGQQQTSSLEDYQTLSTMLAYNNRNKKP